MIRRLPIWFRQELPDDISQATSRFFRESSVDTVCGAAKCPNTAVCFRQKRMTFLILGKVCTRNCAFCNIAKNDSSVLSLDKDEPMRVAQVIKALGLNYAVITSVTRDDLTDGGAGVFAETIFWIRKINGLSTKIEVLIPDFQGKTSSLGKIIEASPDLIAHNLETVKRLYPEVRPSADYQRSLELLRKVKLLNSNIPTKSSLMLGMGETKEELLETMLDLRQALCDCLCLGQYLAPSLKHYPVAEFLTPAQFAGYRNIAREMGFKVVLSAPLARGSYKAQSVYQELGNV
ncbi:MAG: lipoyl synthase [Candidatus Omnitrophica bacterium]|nr:lipoyl synthase [Candidatus Omnitrophota bacterium]